MTDQLRKKLVNLYSVDDAAYATYANKAIEQYFANLPPSKSVADPERLGTRSVFVSKLRADLLDKSGGVDVSGQPEFSQLSTKDQLRFQKQSIVKNINKWVHRIEIMPANIAGIHLDLQDVNALKTLRSGVDTAKLREDVDTVDLGALMNKLFPCLSQPNECRWNALVTGLLLATGRRTIEILKTAKFYLGKSQSMDGYTCFFEGQCKEGLFPPSPFIIPLLVPYNVVAAAMKCVRQRINTTDMTSEAVNLKYAKGVNNFIQAAADMHPHALRAVYAAGTYKISGRHGTLLGWISSALGHLSTGSSAYYTRVKVTNATEPYVPAVMPESISIVPGKVDEWISTCAADAKRIATMREMMHRRIKITASATRTQGGGTMVVINRVLANNAELVNKYNDSL